MNNNIIKLTNKLVSIESIDAKKEKLNEIVDFVMRELKGFTIERFKQNNRPSLLAYVGNKRPEKFKVMLNAHLDVVAGRPDQFCVVEKGGKLWGRGVYDMKAAAAVEILVFKELASKLPYPLGLQLVTDEEMGGTDGTRFQIDAGVRAEFTIAGEGTNFDINAQGYINPYFKTPEFKSGGEGYFVEPGRAYLSPVPKAEIDLYQQNAGVTLTQNPGWF